MPSHEKDGIRLLLEKGPVHPVLWCKLIEARRNLIKPYLDMFTLREVGNLQCLVGESASLPGRRVHTLSADKLALVNCDGGLSFKTQGIFLDGLTYNLKFPDNVKRIVGLARSGEWIVIEIETVLKGDYEELQTLRISRCDLDIILFGGLGGVGIRPEDMWYEFGLAINGWLESRKRMHETILEIERIIETEGMLLLERPGA